MGRVQRARIGGLQYCPDMRVSQLLYSFSLFFVFTFITTLYLFALLILLILFEDPGGVWGSFARIRGSRAVNIALSSLRCPPLAALDNHH
jgi:hypothetical protein